MANQKRVSRSMKQMGHLLFRRTAERVGRRHNGKLIVTRSNVRWCSHWLEFACWNG